MGFFYVNCPRCKEELEVEDQYSGQTMTCPFCKEEFVPLVGGSPVEDPSSDPAEKNEENLPSAGQEAPFAEPIIENEQGNAYLSGEEAASPEQSFPFLSLFEVISRIGAVLVVLCGVAFIACAGLRWNAVRQMPAISEKAALRTSFAIGNISDSLETLRTETEKFRKETASVRLSRILDSAPGKLDLSVPETVSGLEELQMFLGNISDFEKNIRESVPAESQIGKLSCRLKNDLESGRLVLTDTIADVRKNSCGKTGALFRMILEMLLALTGMIVLASLLPALGSYLNKEKI